MELISVIVPVYKVEKYLCRCVDSILAQTYTNLEIILVDDGSPDNCGKICDEYAAKDSRVKVIHQENGGLSAARNAGLDVATGDYIGFVDSDDYIALDMYEKLLKLIVDASSDLAICSMRFCDEVGNLIEQEWPLMDCVLEKEEVFKGLQGEFYWIYVNACPKLYKRFIFENLRFPPEKYYEDNATIHHILIKCCSIVTTGERLYNYTVREGSITHSGLSVRCFDDIDAFLDRIEFYKKNEMNDYLIPAKLQLLNRYRCNRKNIKAKSKAEESIIEKYETKVRFIYDEVKAYCDWKERLFYEHRCTYMKLSGIKALFRREGD